MRKGLVFGMLGPLVGVLPAAIHPQLNLQKKQINHKLMLIYKENTDLNEKDTSIIIN